jgi:hypothetical protein
MVIMKEGCTLGKRKRSNLAFTLRLLKGLFRTLTLCQFAQ